MARILVVDDDAHIRDVVRFALEKAGHTVTQAADGRAALANHAASPTDLIVLDILMPEIDGLEVCREIRRDDDVPILFLSSRDEELDRVLGLELGADDYLTKPFSPRELVARVKGILRRAQPSEARSDGPRTLERGALHIDVDRHTCTWHGEPITLTVTEFDLLHAMLGMAGKVYTRAELVERAYGSGHHITDRTVDSHIRRIRKKFKAKGPDPIETVYGLGYRFVVDPGSGSGST
ncbi:MAG: response regulator transcription factor [bacterium]|nr:response regulator transcription factor [bacterium]